MSFLHFCALVPSGNRVSGSLTFTSGKQQREEWVSTLAVEQRVLCNPVLMQQRTLGQVTISLFLPHDPQATPSAAIFPKPVVSLSKTGFFTHTEQYGEHYILEFPSHCREKQEKRIKPEKINAASNSYVYIEAEGYKRQTRSAKWMKNRCTYMFHTIPPSDTASCSSCPMNSAILSFVCSSCSLLSTTNTSTSQKLPHPWKSRDAWREVFHTKSLKVSHLRIRGFFPAGKSYFWKSNAVY